MLSRIERLFLRPMITMPSDGAMDLHRFRVHPREHYTPRVLWRVLGAAGAQRLVVPRWGQEYVLSSLHRAVTCMDSVWCKFQHVRMRMTLRRLRCEQPTPVQ